jgi:tRNA-modifying protein YgfZ
VIDLAELRTSLPTAWLRTSERVVEVTGADRLTYLDATTSQSLASRAPGEAVGALVLDAHGLALAVLEVLVLEDRVLLVVPDDEVAATVLDILGGRTFLSDARFVLTDLVVLRVFGPAAAEVVSGAFAGVVAGIAPLEPGTVRDADGSVLAREAAGSVRIIGDEAEHLGLVAQLGAAGAVAGDEEAFTAWRVAHGVPAWGREIVAPHLPEELGLLPTHVHLAKGCYPGQETVARMWMLGRPRRRLAVLGVDENIAPERRDGAPGVELEVTSRAHRQGSAVMALGLAPGSTSRGDWGADLKPGGERWQVLDLPGDETVPPGHDPAMRRRRDRPSASARA